MLRSLFALCAGLMAAMIVMTAFAVAASFLYPVPPGLERGGAAAIAAYAASLPLAANLLLLAGWLLAAVGGTVVAARLAPASAIALAIAIGGLDAVLTFLNAQQVPRPDWMLACGVALPVPLALLAVRMLRRASPAPGG
jgi:hypothetical protein